ncbi:DUF421 domain-containing protein [Paenibacillus sp. MBLB4367]|uniref:DUF421 domain-containing protein n=1 Tax=Paenibacillus sp. MBLB4367 TaxID=3384767 RepID=UPI00390828EB
MGTFWEIVLRTIAAFVLILAIARLLGKQTVAQMTFHDFVVTITLGAIAANLAFNTAFHMWRLLLCLLLFSAIAYSLSHLSLKSRSARKWISGKPTIVIENGKILEQNLRKLKLTLDTLSQELREKDIFNLEEVEYAVLELNGRFSVLKKPEYRQVIRKDLAIRTPGKERFPVELIMDGTVIEENVAQHPRKGEEWLTRELGKRNLRVTDICYAVIGTNGKLFIDTYEDHIKKPIDKE